MHIRLSSEFLSLSEVDLRSHGALIDRLLYLHLSKRHLFCLSPKEIVVLRSSIQFGPQAEHALNIILRKSQDYFSSLRASSVHLVILPLGSILRFNSSVEHYISAENAHEMLYEPNLYVENATTDGAFYSLLIKQAAKYVGGTAELLAIRPVHGGGSTLSELIEKNIGPDIKGICICDRDCSGDSPPYVKHSTISKVAEALGRLGVISGGHLTLTTKPFFAFHQTAGWGLENYIGPHTLNYFFECNPESADMRQKFIQLFPQFPNLTDDDMAEWWTVNFKVENQSSISIEQGFSQRGGRAHPGGHRSSGLSQLSVPCSAISWIASCARAGRFHRQLIASIHKDMRINSYREQIVQLARSAVMFLPADDQINFA
ncbi:hypothetical protein JOD31_000822 [Methylopila capsulata]|uniref:Uncharacterized protein n=2 Tax=Methylopila capsulata TaxID=61654 RepID=A0ABS2T375_9HYPH|nr:hypothetical protein [Methylopila capsulata]MBM7850610.1 hypothetical protein [Methylopila capsulata]